MTPDDKTIEILIAEPRRVKIGAEAVEVRELAWLDLLAFVGAVSAVAERFLVKVEGGMTLSLDKLPEVIRSSGDLAQALVCGCTGRDVAWVKSLPARVVVRLVDIALEVNVTEEFFSAGKAVAARMAAVLPVQARAISAASSKP